MHKTLVHGFFDGYFTGLLEARLPEGTRPEPRQLKELAAEHYGTLASTFTATLLPTLLTLRFDTYEAAVADMQQRRFSDNASPKLLLRYAAGTRQAYDTLTAEYRRQMEALLTGRLCPPAENPDTPENTPSKLIRATVRVTMQAYALGVRTGGGTALRQPTVFRLMADAMAVLIQPPAFDTWADMERIGLDGVYRRVCRTQDNYDTLLAEMNQAYDDLARG